MWKAAWSLIQCACVNNMQRDMHISRKQTTMLCVPCEIGILQRESTQKCGFSSVCARVRERERERTWKLKHILRVINIRIFYSVIWIPDFFYWSITVSIDYYELRTIDSWCISRIAATRCLSLFRDLSGFLSRIFIYFFRWGFFAK